MANALYADAQGAQLFVKVGIERSSVWETKDGSNDHYDFSINQFIPCPIYPMEPKH